METQQVLSQRDPRPAFTYLRLQKAIDLYIEESNGRNHQARRHPYHDLKVVWRNSFKYEFEVLEDALTQLYALRQGLKIPRPACIAAFQALLNFLHYELAAHMKAQAQFIQLLGERKTVTAGYMTCCAQKSLPQEDVSLAACVRAALIEVPHLEVPAETWKSLLETFQAKVKSYREAKQSYTGPNAVHYLQMDGDCASEWRAMVNLIEEVRDGSFG